MYKRQPEHIGTVIERLFSRLGFNERYQKSKVITAWEDIVGEQVARVTSAERIIGKKLFVRVSDSTWRHELHLRKKDIVFKINKHLGSKVVDDIKFN